MLAKRLHVHAALLMAATFRSTGDQPGGAVFTDEKFKSELLGEVKTIKSKFDEVSSDYTRLDKSTKDTIETLTAVKKDFSGLSSDVAQATFALRKLQAQLLQEQRAAFGNPAERIIRCEEKRTLFNAICRSAVSKKYNLELSEAHQKALDTANTPGSTYIVSDLMTDVYDTLATYGMWSSFQVRQLSTKSTIMPVKTARAAAAFLTSEGGAITPDSTKAGTSVTATVATIASLLSVSEELMQDSEVDVTADVLSDMAESVASKIDWACTQADGGADATDGGFTGIFGGGGTASVAAAGNVSVQTLDLEDFLNTMLVVDPIVLSRPAKWWTHPQQIVRMLSIKDLNGRPIFLTAMEAPAPGAIGSILGYPVVPTFQAPSANTISTRIAVFGDPAGQVVGIRKAFEFKQSNEAYFTDYEIGFRGIARIATKIRRALAFGVLTTAAA